jgi:hypothetical protein
MNAMTDASMDSKALSRARLWDLGALAVLAGLVQLGMHVTFLPWWCGDSVGYAEVASILYGSDFTHYLGERMPGYPVFLLGCELLAGGRVGWVLSPHAAQVVTWAQSALFVASVLLTYLTIERLGVRRKVNLAVCLVFALLVGPAEFALILLSEILCLFLLILATYFVVVGVDLWRVGKALNGLPVAAGLTYGFAMMVRPNELFIWGALVLAVPVLAFVGRLRGRKFAVRAILHAFTRPLLAGGALLLVLWSFVRFETEGIVTLTELTDLDRSCVAYNIFDRVHPQDKVLGDIMVKYYRQTNGPGHVEREYIWQALPEISARAAEMPVPVRPGYESLRPYAVYAYIGRVSNELLLENPGVWARNSLSDMAGTLDFRFYHPPLEPRDDPRALPQGSVVINRIGWRIVGWLNLAEAPVILLGYMLTFAAWVIGVARTLAAADLAGALVPLAVTALAAGTIGCMIAPSILSIYIAPRFSVPLIPVFALCSAYVFEEVIRAREARRGGSRADSSTKKGAGALAPAPRFAPNPKV